MKTAELTGALLDYWTARAEGVPAEQLEIREVPRTDWKICVRTLAWKDGSVIGCGRLDYSTNWAPAGPLVEKYHLMLESNMGGEWAADCFDGDRMQWYRSKGDTPLIAICRAVVRAAFGDEVEDLPC